MIFARIESLILEAGMNDALNRAEEYIKAGADGIMIGRGSMGAPWLIGQIDCALNGKKVFEDPSPRERLQLALEQLQELLNRNGEHGLLIAKKHMKWSCQGFKDANDLQHALVRAKTSLEAIELLQNQLIIMS